MKRPWRKTEISAVMKHFKTHIANGDLTTKLECEQCKIAEHPALKNRSQEQGPCGQNKIASKFVFL